MIGWLIAAGIIGASIGSSKSKETTHITYQVNPYYNYGSRIPSQHKKCYNCHHSETSVFVVKAQSNFVKLKFKCNHCGNTWAKNYFL